MNRLGTLIGARQTARISALTLLVYFAAEWVVSATWRGHYGYRDVTVGPLGVPFCGPSGTWPCSALSPVMNVALVITGLAIAALACAWMARTRTAWPHALMLVIAGAGFAAAGIITEKIDYPLHSLTMNMFGVLGALGCVLIGVSSTTRLHSTVRLVLTAGGILSTIGYFCYTAGFTGLLGAGGTQRLIIYPILIALLIAGLSGGTASDPAAPAPGDTSRDSRDERTVAA